MQLVHAFDMMKMTHGDRHEMTEITRSIFCETSTQSEKTECAKEIIPDKLSLQSRTDDLIHDFSSTLPIFFILSENTKSNPLDNKQKLGPPGNVYEKTSYSNLVGIIKNLN